MVIEASRYRGRGIPGKEQDAVPSDIPGSSTHVDLSYNHITTLASQVFSHLTVCTDLDLTYNHISIISDGAFDGMAKLEKLSLSQNRIEHLHAAMFRGLSALTRLLLTHNPVQTLPSQVFAHLTACTYISQGSRLVFQSVVFQLIFATLNMFLENTQIAGRKLKIRQDQFLEQFFLYLSGQKYH